MNPTWGEVVAILLLFAAAYSLTVFLRHLRRVRQLSQEMVEVPVEKLPTHKLRSGEFSYRVSETDTIRMSRWDTLSPEEKLQSRRLVERWGLAVGLFFIGALIIGFVAAWALDYYAPVHWLNQRIF